MAAQDNPSFQKSGSQAFRPALLPGDYVKESPAKRAALFSSQGANDYESTDYVLDSPVMVFEPGNLSEEDLNREKEKARRLRRTQWWLNKIQKGVCYYCGKDVGRMNLTMDHVVPLSRGGKSKKGNIVAACKKCNNKKKYMLPLEWEEYLKSLAEKSVEL
jgi:hypothetical protein